MSRLQLARWWLACLATLLGACSTTPSPRYYILDRASQSGTFASGPSVAVESVDIPAEVDRPQFVLAGEGNEVTIDDQHRWAAPLQASLAEALESNLAASLGAADVATERIEGPPPRYRVRVEILGFQSWLGKEVRVEAAWQVRRDDGASRWGRASFRESAPGDFSALAAAHSRTVARLASEIAGVIRVAEEQRYELPAMAPAASAVLSAHPPPSAR